MLALVDGDIIAFRCAASCEPNKIKLEREPLAFAISRADELCYRILSETKSDEYRIFLSGTENFRKLFFPDYKANRSGRTPPEWLDPVREFLVREWSAEICSGYEADDGIAMSVKEGTIVCSIDKDLKQLPGQHYNFVKNEFEEINDAAAAYNFYSQMLIGDTSDNVRGVDGIGPVKAGKLLHGHSAEEMHNIVRDAYNDEQRFLRNYRLFRLIRTPEELAEIEATIRKGQGPEFTESSSC